jgi:hypothetical protein
MKNTMLPKWSLVCLWQGRAGPEKKSKFRAHS